MKPTNSELEILQIIWKKEPCTVREVNEELVREKGGAIGYTTTLKLMQIMFEKGMLTRETGSKTHTYRAVVSRSKTGQGLLDGLIQNVFEGSAAKLVMQALSDKKSSKEEIEMIKKYLDEIEKKIGHGNSYTF